VVEQVGGHRRDDQAGLVERLLEVGDDAVPGRGVGAERHQVVVVETDAVRTEFGELVDGLDRVERGTGGLTERVARLPADGPETEGELVVTCWLHRHGYLRETRLICLCVELFSGVVAMSRP
jgi:hypothetical protein